MIITLGRQHGSNGHDIARALADALGYTCYGKEIVDHAAENSSFSKEILDTYDEKRVSSYIVPTPHYIGMNEGFRLNLQIATAQFDTIRSLADKDTTMIIVTHEMGFAHDVSDNVIFMDGGVIVEQGPPSQVLENPAEERTRQFLRGYSK